MNRVGHDAFQEQVLDAFLKFPDQHHLAIKRKEKLFFVWHSYSPARRGAKDANALISKTLSLHSTEAHGSVDGFCA
jgi:hypothetical protein